MPDPHPVPVSPNHRLPDPPPVPVSPNPRVPDPPPISASPSHCVSASPPPPRILLADDHGLFVEGLQNLLQAGGYPVVGAASDGLEALQLARELHPDLILMDIRMPNCTGLEATRMIQAELPEIQIVILTTSAEDADLFEALKCGASGYLLKNLKPNVLFDYLQGLARGEAPLSPELSARLLREFTRQAAALDERGQPFGGSGVGGAGRQGEMETRGNGDTETGSPGPRVTLSPAHSLPGPELTPRQRQILEMIAQGASYKEVGAALHVSENTVKYHMGEILQRLHVKNRAQVLAYVLRNRPVKD
jgi:DNA-binding NarL/FixJ family response regulator